MYVCRQHTLPVTKVTRSESVMLLQKWQPAETDRQTE